MKRLLFCGAGFLLVLAALVAFAAPKVIESRYNRVVAVGPYKPSPDAETLQGSLLIADLHSDSLLWGRNLLKHSNTGHVDVPRLAHANVALQAFTVVTQIPRQLKSDVNSNSSDLVRYLAIAEAWPPETWNSPKQRALYQAGRLHKYQADSHDSLVIIKSRADLRQFLDNRKSARRVASFLGIEGAAPLEGSLDNLDDLYAAGFRMMAPTHFTDTPLGGSASGLRKTGLTELGRKWVRLMEAKGMLIDLAHASPATLRDVTAIATKPLVVSHAGVRGTCNNNRNLSDTELRAVARTGGVIGIGYWQTATCGRDADSIARAIRYAVGIVGIEAVALGSDFDGSTVMPFDATGIVLITDALLKAGFSEHDIRLIMGQNTVRVLSQVLPQ